MSHGLFFAYVDSWYCIRSIRFALLLISLFVDFLLYKLMLPNQ